MHLLLFYNCGIDLSKRILCMDHFPTYKQYVDNWVNDQLTFRYSFATNVLTNHVIA